MTCCVSGGHMASRDLPVTLVLHLKVQLVEYCRAIVRVPYL